MDTILAAVNRNVEIIEIVVVVVIVLLLISIVVTSRRRKKPSMPEPAAEPSNYYADLQQQPSGRPDRFGTFGAATTQAPIPPASSGAQTNPVFPTPAVATTSPVFPTPAVAPAAVAPAMVAHATDPAPFPSSTTPSATTAPAQTAPATTAPATTAPAPSAPSLEAQGTLGGAPSWQPDTWTAVPAVTASTPNDSSAGAASYPEKDNGTLDGHTTAPAAYTPSPPAGTQASWLPDPSGTPDTLRYWDGNAWTQHFAQRS